MPTNHGFPGSQSLQDPNGGDKGLKPYDSTSIGVCSIKELKKKNQ